jgi:hypothetical protein
LPQAYTGRTGPCVHNRPVVGWTPVGDLSTGMPTTAFVMHRFALELTTMLAVASVTASPARGADVDIAECVAVMQLQADELARQVKAGNARQEAALRTELERAAALIGRAYLDGAHDEAAAKAKLKAAQDAMAGKSDAQRATMHEACVQRADAELAAASGPQRFIVEWVAKSRMRRMLAAP